MEHISFVLVFLVSLFIHSKSETSPNKDQKDGNLYLIKLNDPAALCLDGSPGSLYISRDGDPKKIHLHFQGGGWCDGPNDVKEIINSCYERSKGQWGSSKNYPETMTFQDGVLSTNEQNPFRDWTRVYLRYCDGSGHQGSRFDPIEYNGTKLYFRGHNITVAQLDRLEKQTKIFSQATHVVVGGGSAGALAVFMWANYIKENVKKGKVWAYSDSGVFLNAVNIQTMQETFKNSMRNLLIIANSEVSIPVPQCVLKHPNQMQNCMFAEDLFPFLKTPIFISQSLYDTFNLPAILGIKCVNNLAQRSLANCSETQMQKIEEYHKNMTLKLLEIASINNNGIWAPACAAHGFDIYNNYYSMEFRVPEYSQNSVSHSLWNWINNPQKGNNKYIDLGKWPQNRPCAGKLNFKIEQQLE